MKRLLTLLGVLVLAAAARAQAPNLALKDIDGKRVVLKDVLANGPVLLSFWATWCHPCQEELVHIQKLYTIYADSGLGVLAVAIDDSKTRNKVRSVAKGKRLTMPVVLDTEQEAMLSFGLSDVPGVFILDRGGKKLYEHAGYKPGDEAQLEEQVRIAIRLDRATRAPAASDSAAAPDTSRAGGGCE
jgi:cytochrome c biogenesis protein CcmG, thiol:disulfide interchange protein DsbE